jgi:hypothetical protein
MRIGSLRRTLAAVVLVLAALAGSAVVAVATTAAQPTCDVTWGSLARAQERMSTASLTDARVGQHDCFDRVVFDFGDTAATGYRVEYADQVLSEGKGDPLTIAGGAKLRVVLLEPAYDVNTGASTYPHDGHVANVAGFQTLRDVVYGGSFEGNTTFGVGVRARLPFRVFTLAGPGTSSRIVLDIAHHW